MAAVDIPSVGEVLVTRSSRARRISIRISRKGEIRLTHPFFCPLDEAVSFLESKKDWVLKTRSRILETVSGEKSYTKEEIKKLKSDAETAFPEKVRAIAEEYGFRYRSVRIGTAYSKWGSCSRDNVIMLSVFLVNIPEHLQNFVILHELCHTVHHNHSARFHALLDRACGGKEKELRRELRKWHTR